MQYTAAGLPTPTHHSRIETVLLSYRHAFHAGNHADVLKHLVLVQVLDHLNRKESPWWLIDTHAGAGIYDLASNWARSSKEAQSGVRRLMADNTADAHNKIPAPVQRYLDALHAFNRSGALRWYAGSPWLGLHAMRTQDRLRLFEMHPTESEVLAHNIRCLAPQQQRRIGLSKRDGFTGLQALLPPPSRRGLVLIDPSFEDKQDYRRVLNAVRDALRRFAHGSYCIWHPLVQRHDVAKEVEKLVQGLKKLAPADWLHATLQVSKPPPDGRGLYASGVFLINPPWTLAASLRQTLPWLARTLAQDAHAGHQLHAGSNAARPTAVRAA